MRSERTLRWIVGVLLALVVAALPVMAFAQDDDAGHEEGGRLLLTRLPTETRQRARSLWSRVVCKCPRENWSKSLLNCPDGCADPQKTEIVARIREGWDDQRILDEQRELHGPRAIGMPDDSATYILPFSVLVIAGVLAVVTLLHIRRKKDAVAAQPVQASDEEIAAVLRELEEVT